MDILQFSQLSSRDQLDILYRDGIYIGKVKTEKFVLLLYQLEEYYVELVYIKHRQVVFEINLFKSAALLDMYLSNINIDDLKDVIVQDF